MLAGVGLVAQAAVTPPTFVEAVGHPFLSGGSAGEVTMVDLNGDGHLDLLATNDTAPHLTVRWGDGSGRFSSLVTLPSFGNFHTVLQVADLNGDGHPDILVAYGTQVDVLHGDGAGAFTVASGIETSHGIGHIRVADLNGDGRQDLITTSDGNAPTNVSIQNVDGSFGALTAFMFEHHPTSGERGRFQGLVVQDVNADTHVDLLRLDELHDELWVALGDGTGSFDASHQFPLEGDAPFALAVADVNADGKPDVLTSDAVANTLNVLLGNGTGGFGAPDVFPTGGDYPFYDGVNIGDLNGDNKPDVVVTHISSKDLTVLLGDGAGDFGTPLRLPTAGYPLYSTGLVDVNEDGKGDLYFSTRDYLGVLLNTTGLSDTLPPTGTPLATGTSGASNGQAYVPVRLQDASSGVKKVQLTTSSTNVHLEYPLGTVVASPYTFPVPVADRTVYAVKDSNAKARVELRVWDNVNNTAVVDPIVASLELKKTGQLTRTFKKIPQAERYVRLQNGMPGFKNARLWFNGKIISKGNLTDGQVVDLDVAEWLKPGSRNTAKIVASGPKGATAILTIGDVATGTAAPLRARLKVNLEFSR